MEKQILLDGKKLYYRITGAGEPLLLIHGFSEDADMWTDFRTAFEHQFMVITPDLPGYYRSQMPDEPLSMELFADAMSAILDAEVLSKANVIGHSMGGYIALAFAERHEDRLLRLGLFHSHAYADDAEKKEIRHKTVSLIEKHGAAPFIREFHPGLFAPGFANEHTELIESLRNRVSEYDEQVITRSLTAMAERPDRSQVLRNIEVPVLFIIGKEDTSVPYSKSVQQSYLPEVSQVEILNHVGHMGMYEAAAQTQSILQNFLNLRL